MINIMNQIPKGIPLGWECNMLTIGRLMYVGLSDVQLSGSMNLITRQI